MNITSLIRDYSEHLVLHGGLLQSNHQHDISFSSQDRSVCYCPKW